MLSLAGGPTISELESFISKVSSFPVTARQLVKKATAGAEPPKIIEFYKSFAPDRWFENREDLDASSQMVEMVRQERPQMPREEELAAEDY